MDLKPRLTTAEAAKLLGCNSQCALQLLKAAHIPNTRTSRFGAHLWDAESVSRLVTAIKPERAVGA